MNKNNRRIEEITSESISSLLDCEVQMKIKDMVTAENLIKASLEEGIVYNYDSVEVGYIKDVKIDFENIIEARFFDEKREIRIFHEEDELSGVIFRELEEERKDVISSEFLLYPIQERKNHPYEVKVKKYIDYDEDNQAYISYLKPTRLCFKERE